MVVPLRKLTLLASACALALIAPACGGGDEKASPNDVPANAVALVGEQEIPKAEFDELMAQARASYKTQNRPFPKAGTAAYQELKNRAMEFLVQRYEYRQEAEAMGIEVTDGQVDKRLEEAKKQYFGGSEKRYKAELRRQGLTEEQVREGIRDSLLREAIFKAVTKGVEVTDKEIEAYYKKHEEQFTQPASRDIRHILVKKKERADELYADLKEGANFARLAQRFSQDPGSKDKGGKYLGVTKGQFVPAFDRVAFSLDAGQLSKPVKTQFGWHIIEALSPVKSKSVTPLAKVKESIRQQLLQQERNKAANEWMNDLEKKYEDDVTYAVGYSPPKTGTGTTTNKQ